jgi:hypothetical protein
MTRSTTCIVITACVSILCLFGAAGADAKGGSPGFHSFSHHEASLFVARTAHACGAWSGRTTWTCPHR